MPIADLWLGLPAANAIAATLVYCRLVQLALWLPPGGPALPPELYSSSSGGSDAPSSSGDSANPPSRGCALCLVLLLDMLALPDAAAKRALQQLFR